MSAQRPLRITNLRERIDRAQYRVDVDRVAESILGRPAARLLVIPGSAISVEENADPAADDDLDPPPSEDVLEAA